MTAPAKAAPMREDVTPEDRELFIFLLGFDAVADVANFHRIRNGEFDHWEKMQTIVAYRLAHTARPDAGDEDVERVTELVARLREIKRGEGHSFPVEKAWRVIPYGNMINEAADMIEHLAAMREGVDRGMVERLEAERTFLLDRAGFAGKMRFGGPRCTGMSSNAIVAVAFGQTDPGDMPYDSSDLAACYRALKLLPCHLLTGPVANRLTSAEAFVEDRYPGSVAEAQSAAEWPGFAAPEQPR